MARCARSRKIDKIVLKGDSERLMLIDVSPDGKRFPSVDMGAREESGRKRLGRAIANLHV